MLRDFVRDERKTHFQARLEGQKYSNKEKHEEETPYEIEWKRLLR